MKKILLIASIILSVFLIYLITADKKVYYLALGDSLIMGSEENQNNYGYIEYVRDYLKDKKILEKYVIYANKENRITDLINDINDNKKITINNKQIPIKNALVKADLLTLSIGYSDLLYKINVNKDIDYNNIYNYADQIVADLDDLLKQIRQYCKEDIILTGFYNFIIYSNIETDKVFQYINEKYESVAKKYRVTYINLYESFHNPRYLYKPNAVYPSKSGYKFIADEIIKKIDTTLLK